MTAINLAQHPIVGNVAGIKDLEGNFNLGYAQRDTVQRHTVGRRFLTDFGSVYRYSGAGDTLKTDHLAQTITGQHMGYAAIAVAASIGDKQVRCTFGSGDGAASSGAVTEDEMQGGSIILWPTPTSICMNRNIEHNSALASTGTIIYTLDFPINVDLTTASSKAEAMASMYQSVGMDSGRDGPRSLIGLPMVAAIDGEWCWLQTWGICWVTPSNQSGKEIGNVDHSYQVVGRHDGSLQTHETYTAADTPTVTEYTNGVEQQHVGFTVSSAQGTGQGAPFIMLQISQ